MIKLATVFSGIGAIEHALQRMNLEHEIVFACDNGDVEILTKEIGMSLDDIERELKELGSLVTSIQFNDDVEDLYKDQLVNMLREASLEYERVIEKIQSISRMEYPVAIELLKRILAMDDVKASRIKEYKKFLAEINVGTEEQMKLKEFQVLLEILNDYKKDNSLDDLGKDMEFKSSDQIDWRSITDLIKSAYERLETEDGKKIIRRVQDLSQRTSQLHEKINYMKVQKQLESLGEDWKARKEYVDSLYSGQEKKNKVKLSYMANYDISDDDFHWNVAFLDGKQYVGEVDLFVGGSPCQSFSLVGKQRGLEDTRGTLFYEYARLIDEIKPKVFIYENVRAVTSHDEGKTWKKMQEVFKELGYDFKWTVLNAKNYGIPQNRERLFVVGIREDIVQNCSFEFPEAIPLKKKMQDFLLDNVSGAYYLKKKGVDFVTSEKNLTKRFTQIDGEVALCQKKNQQFNWHGDFVFVEENKDMEKTMENLEKYFLSEKVEKYVMASGTKNFYSRPQTDLEVARPLLTTMHKMHRAGVDNYVHTQGRLRKLTPRECLRLMGFCDSFKIEVSDTSMYQQAGNSIVVDVLIAIVKKIIDSVGHEFDI